MLEFRYDTQLLIEAKISTKIRSVNILLKIFRATAFSLSAMKN